MLEEVQGRLPGWHVAKGTNRQELGEKERARGCALQPPSWLRFRCGPAPLHTVLSFAFK